MFTEILPVRELEPTREPDVDFRERAQITYGSEHTFLVYSFAIYKLEIYRLKVYRLKYTGLRYTGLRIHVQDASSKGTNSKYRGFRYAVPNLVATYLGVVKVSDSKTARMNLFVTPLG